MLRKFTWKQLSKLHVVFATFGSVASIIALCLTIFKSNTLSKESVLGLTIFTLIFLLLIVTTFLIKVYNVFKNSLSYQYPNQTKKLSTFYKYRTDDAKNIEYEVFKNIQCKRILLTEYEHGFNWTGSIPPIIESDLQDVQQEVIKGMHHEYDKIILSLKNPLGYNDAGVMHIRMKLDDSDQRSATRLESRVEYPVEMIHFRVELRYKPKDYDRKATLSRQRINSTTSAVFDHICYINFDLHTKCYDYPLLNPEPGFFYRIEWER